MSKGFDTKLAKSWSEAIMVTPFPQMVNTWVCDTIPVTGMWTGPSRWHLTQFQWMPGGPIPVDGVWPNPSPRGCCGSQS